MPRDIPEQYNDHLSVVNAAHELNCSIRKVWYLIDAGTLDVIRLKGPRTLVTPDSLRAYIAPDVRGKQ